MRNRKRVVVDTALFERVNKLLLIDNINGNLSDEERKLNPKVNDSIDIASVQFDNGNTIDIKLCSDDEEYYLYCTLNDADGKKLCKFDNLYYLDKHFLFHYIDNAHKINAYEISFSLCDIETLQLGAIEIQEVLDFYETNKDKSFEFFCDYFDADVEDIRSEEDIEAGEEPWLEANVYYKHLEFNMHEEELIPDVIGIQNGDNYEDLDICEFWYGSNGEEKSPKYYKLWLPENVEQNNVEQENVVPEETVSKEIKKIKEIPMILVVRTYSFDPDTCVRKFSSEEAALDFIKADYENELKDELENEHKHDLCEDKSFFDADEGRAELTTVFYAVDGNTYYDSIVWQLVTSVVDCQDK